MIIKEGIKYQTQSKKVESLIDPNTGAALSLITVDAGRTFEIVKVERDDNYLLWAIMTDGEITICNSELQLRNTDFWLQVDPEPEPEPVPTLTADDLLVLGVYAINERTRLDYKIASLEVIAPERYLSDPEYNAAVDARSEAQLVLDKVHAVLGAMESDYAAAALSNTERRRW